MKFGKKPGDRRSDEAGTPADKTPADKTPDSTAGDVTKKDADTPGQTTDTLGQTPDTPGQTPDTAAQPEAPGETSAGTGEKQAGADDASTDPSVEPRTTDSGGDDAAAEPDGSGKARWRKSTLAAAAGAVVFTVAAAVLGWQWAEHNDPGPSEVNTAFVGGSQTETTQVAEAARNIVQGVFSYSYEDLDTYQDSLKKFLDADMLGRYQETADQNVQIITQAKTKIEAKVGDGNVGVEKLDGDTATAVVIMERTGTNGDSQQISDAAPLRMEMVKVDGQWKASDMTLL